MLKSGVQRLHTMRHSQKVIGTENICREENEMSNQVDKGVTVTRKDGRCQEWIDRRPHKALDQWDVLGYESREQMIAVQTSFMLDDIEARISEVRTAHESDIVSDKEELLDQIIEARWCLCHHEIGI